MEQVERGLKQAEVDGRRKAEEVQTVKNKVGRAHLFVRVWPNLRLLRVSVNVCVGGWGLGVQSEGYNIYYFSLWWTYYFLQVDHIFCDVVNCLFVKQGWSKVIDHVRVNASPAITAWSIVSSARYDYFSLHHVCCIVPLHCVALSPVLWNKSSSHHVIITNCTCLHQDRYANYYENVFLKLVVFFVFRVNNEIPQRKIFPCIKSCQRQYNS